MKGHTASSPFVNWRGASSCLLLMALVVSVGSDPALATETTKIKIGGAGTSLSTMRLLASAFEKANPDVTVNVLPSLGSTGGIKAAAAGAVDIGTSSRPLSDVERGQGLTVVEYGRTPLVFAVPKVTRASEVTTAQLVDIYYGKMTAWPSGDPIRVIMRPPSDTNLEKLKNLSQQMSYAVTAASTRPGMLLALTDADVAEFLNSVPGALGVMSLSEILANPNPLNTLKLDGIAPNPASLDDGSYPLYLTMEMVIDKTPTPAATRFIGFVQSAPGREILVNTGHSVSVPGRTKP